MVMNLLELCHIKGGKPVPEGEGRQRLVGHVSLEELWKSPLNSVACRIGFQEKGLGWGTYRSCHGLTVPFSLYVGLARC